MACENAKKDENCNSTLLAVDDSTGEVRSVKADSTGALLVKITDDDSSDDYSSLKTEIYQTIYPVGSVYISGSSEMPTEVADIGTWSRLEGVCIYGASDTDEDFTYGTTGGEKEHELTDDEMPKHTHRTTMDDHTYFYGGTISTDGPATGSGYKQCSHDLATGISGNNVAHNNLSPYISKYMWERTA